MQAKRDVNVTAAQDTQSESHYSMVKREANGLGKVVAAAIAIADPISALTPNSLNNLAVAALLTKKAQTNDQATTSTTAVGSQLTGGTIDVRSGRDTLIQGANVVADGDVNIHAQRDLTITTAENTQSGHAHSSEKTVGLLRFEATGSSVGKREQGQAQQNAAVTQIENGINADNDVFAGTGENTKGDKSPDFKGPSDLDTHLSVGGPHKNNVYGAHNDDAYHQAIKDKGFVDFPEERIELAPGVYQNKYIDAKGNVSTKTTYDPGMYTDAQMQSMSRQAVIKMQSEVNRGIGTLPTSANPVQTYIDGVPFVVIKNTVQGKDVFYAYPAKK